MKAGFRTSTGAKATSSKAEPLCFKTKCRDLTSCSEGKTSKSKTTKNKSDSSNTQSQTNTNLTQVEKSIIMNQ